MKKHIDTRKELFLAKIAGKDVNVETLTPPVPISAEEELMLDIADRISNIDTSTKDGISDVSDLPITDINDNTIYRTVTDVRIFGGLNGEETPVWQIQSEADLPQPSIWYDRVVYCRKEATFWYVDRTDVKWAQITVPSEDFILVHDMKDVRIEEGKTYFVVEYSSFMHLPGSMTCVGVYEKTILDTFNVRIVDTLPESGEIATTDNTHYVCYFAKDIMDVYADTTGAGNWISAADMFEMQHVDYRGIVYNVEDPKSLPSSGFYFIVNEGWDELAPLFIDVDSLPSNNQHISKNSIYRVPEYGMISVSEDGGVLSVTDISANNKYEVVIALPTHGKIFTTDNIHNYWYIRSVDQTIWGDIDGNGTWMSAEDISEQAGVVYNGIVDNIKDCTQLGTYGIRRYRNYAYNHGAWEKIATGGGIIDVANITSGVFYDEGAIYREHNSVEFIVHSEISGEWEPIDGESFGDKSVSSNIAVVDTLPNQGETAIVIGDDSIAFSFYYALDTKEVFGDADGNGTWKTAFELFAGMNLTYGGVIHTADGDDEFTIYTRINLFYSVIQDGVPNGLVTWDEAMESILPLVITITPDSETSGTSDVTAKQMLDAKDRGQSFEIHTDLGGVMYTLPVQSVSIRSGLEGREIAMTAGAVDGDTSVYKILSLPWSSGDDNTWLLNFYQMTPIT